MFNWKVRYLDCCGACSIYEVEEEYRAWTPYGVWRKFLAAHPRLPTGYTDRSHFTNFVGFCKMVEFDDTALRRKNHDSND